LIGGSSALNIAIGIVRIKAMAVMLGPTGIALFGLYGSIANLTQNIAGMGINSSGVRQIAEATSSGDVERIARTTTVLRRTSVLLGVLGALALVVCSKQVSTLTFGNNQNAAAVSLLSLAVLFQLVSAGQAALIQGMRRIADLAKLSVLGALSGTLISIPIVYFFHERGVVPSLVGVAVTTAITSWWYSRKISIQPSSMTSPQVKQETAALLKLGLAFMSSSLMAIGVAYAIRVIVLRNVGFEATGFYQSAWTLGGLYVGFILQAMGADFYPRLTANASDNTVCNRLVNEQTRVGMLLAGPGIVATLTFAPVIMTLFYSTKFGAAVELLRWVSLGAMLQVIVWPLSFIIVAKGKQMMFFCTELSWALVSLVIAWICLKYFGLNGAGIAFFGSYVFLGFLLYNVVNRLSAFRWSTANKRDGLFFLSLTTSVFCGFHLLPLLVAVCLGTLAVLLSGAYSIRLLRTLISWEDIPHSVRQLLLAIGYAPPSSAGGN
jgi:PST family polysaccharide transporter